MVAAVHFFADHDDEQELLSYILSASELKLFPWEPMSVRNPTFISPDDALHLEHVGILNSSLGDLVLIRPPGGEFTSETKSGIFNIINWGAWKSRRGHGIVDWDRTPALFWDRAAFDAAVLYQSNIGSQARSMGAVSPEYEKWVKRAMSWVRRRGTNVWHWTDEGGHSDYDVDLWGANACYALPGALERLRDGTPARYSPERENRRPPRSS